MFDPVTRSKSKGPQIKILNNNTLEVVPQKRIGQKFEKTDKAVHLAVDLKQAHLFDGMKAKAAVFGRRRPCSKELIHG
ncbi:MAG: hypothetical protein OXC60_05105 [Litoreibacter sp.]|nr:hypothetical protein [Litoreibacter sp.]